MSGAQPPEPPPAPPYASLAEPASSDGLSAAVSLQAVQYALSDLIKIAAKEPQPLVQPKRGRKKEGADAEPAAGLTDAEKAAEKAREDASIAKLFALPKPACAEKALNHPKTLSRILGRARRYQERFRERQALHDLLESNARTDAAGKAGDFSEYIKFDCPKVRPDKEMAKFPEWERDDDRDLLRGSLRHGWITNVRQEALQEYFDDIRCAVTAHRERPDRRRLLPPCVLPRLFVPMIPAGFTAGWLSGF